MTAEITGAKLENKTITITAIDCSQERMMNLERLREEDLEKEYIFEFDTRDPRDLKYIRWWLRSQECTKAILPASWGEVLANLKGHFAVMNRKYITGVA